MSVRIMRRRVATVATAVATIVTTAPFLSAAPASALDAVTLATIPENTLAPNAGFLGKLEQGIQGRTPVFVVTLDPSDALKSVTVDLVGQSLVTTRDLGGPDAFAIYKDKTGAGRVAGFDPLDFADGPVSTGYQTEFLPGKTRIVISGGTAATGDSTYFVTFKPSEAPSADNRQFTATVPAGSVVTTPADGSLPANDVTTPTLTIDSRPPSDPVKSHFAVNRRPPGTPDYYVVNSEVDAFDQNKMIAFFQDATNKGAENLLRTDVADPKSYAIHEVSRTTANQQMSVGDGTGITKNNPVARNNQKTDIVYVRSLDRFGNLSPNAVALDHTPAGPDTVDRRNDVSAPKYDTITVTLPDGISALNAGPTQANNVKVTTTITNGDTDNQVWATSQEARLVHVDEFGNQVSDHATDWNAKAITGTPSADHRVDGRDGTKLPELGRILAEVRLIDAAGNVTETGRSAAVIKDTVAPSIFKIGLVQDGGTANRIDTGDIVRVFFTEPMDTSDIDDTGGARTMCDLDAPGGTTNNGSAKCVNKVLKLEDPTATSTSTEALPAWGRDPAFQWGADGLSALITVGADACPPDPTPTAEPNEACSRPLHRLPNRVKDRVFADALTDPRNNVLTGRTNFSSLGTVPALVETLDGPNPADASRFGTDRDGVLDAIKVQFSENLDAASISAARENFRISVPGDPNLVPTNVVAIDSKSVQLWFTPSEQTRTLWLTGAKPTVQLLAQSDSGCVLTAPCTGLKTLGGAADVPAFLVGAVDKAAPMVFNALTNDADHDGRIDQVIVKYTEPIDHGLEDQCGYTAAGYTPAAPGPGGNLAACGSVTVAGAQASPNTRTPTSGLSDTTTINLVEKTTVFDTDALPIVRFDKANPNPTVPPTGGTQDQGIRDAGGNELALWFTSTSGDSVLDGAQPAPVAWQTRDRNTNGSLDAIAVQFSEPLSSGSIGNGVFAVTEPTHAVVGLGVESPTTVAVLIDETTLPGVGDTDVRPKVNYTGGVNGGITDGPTRGAPNQAYAALGPKQADDKAGPAVVSASFNYSGLADDPGVPTTPPGGVSADDGKKMKIVFSEPIADPDVTKLEAFQAGHTPAEAEKPTASAATTPADTRARILTFANVFDLFKNGTVRITEANAVKDLVAGTPNGNAQLNPVLFSGFPTATLSLAGPAGSRPGFSTSYTLTVNAGGNEAVSSWLLVVQDAAAPAPATPAANDGRWTTAKPTSFTLADAVDGTYKGFLWTKDSIGNISHTNGATPPVPAEATIRVIGGVPTIANIGFTNVQNIRTPTLVRDGDDVRVTAHARGNDAQSWAVPGNCAKGTDNLQHMGIDYRALTGVASMGNVAPTACDFRSGTPPYRAMEFRFVKVGGTTHYPVGTVLRTSTSDPGWLLEDGPNGAITKRQYVSVGARRSWGIRDGEVIQVSPYVLTKYPTGVGKVTYRQGMVFRRSDSRQLFVSDRGRKRPMTGSYAHHWRVTSTMVVVLSHAEFNTMPYGPTLYGTYHPLGSYIKDPANGKVYVITAAPSGQPYRRPILSPAALTSHLPWSQVYTAIPKDLTLPVDPYSRGYRDGTLLRDSAGKFYVVSRGNARHITSPTVFNGLGYNGANRLVYEERGLGRVAGSGPVAGAPVGTNAVPVSITVTNTAGATVTASITTITGLGTVEAPPAALPRTVPPRP